MSKPVLVILGQHRGGTSLLSGSLNRVGGFMGEGYEYEADQTVGLTTLIMRF